MPNGGYPMHYLMSLAGTDLVIHANASQVYLKRRLEPRVLPSGRTVPSFETLGEFSVNQLSALLYHLKYWGKNSEGKFNNVRIQPQYNSAGCLYDY
jgi:hypothetical protein